MGDVESHSELEEWEQLDRVRQELMGSQSMLPILQIRKLRPREHQGLPQSLRGEWQIQRKQVPELRSMSLKGPNPRGVWAG